MCVYVHVHTAMWSLYSSQWQKRGGNRMVGEVISSERSATETICLISHNSLCRQDILLRNLGVMNCTLKANKRYQKSSFFYEHVYWITSPANLQTPMELWCFCDTPLSVTWRYDKRVMRCKKAWVMDYRHHGNISATHCDVTSGQGGAVEGILRPKTNFLIFYWSKKSSEKYGHFLIGLHTIGLPFETSRVTHWPWERIIQYVGTVHRHDPGNSAG